nr:immunoglobulin light chain junction region [Macaca mulatta]MOX78438.1 immunoglobulin light chain junction region [Macaca mulatta]MOX82909.1 immunoglobulin light chain junction region [Macaca mulatta]
EYYCWLYYSGAQVF